MGMAPVPPRVAPATPRARTDHRRGRCHRPRGNRGDQQRRQPPNAGFGTAQDLATFQGANPQLAAQLAALRHRFGSVDVIENQTLTVPGSTDTYDLRAQDPHGPFGQPMLALVSGRFPAGPGQVAVTQGVASDFRLRIGDRWRAGGVSGSV